MHVYITYTAEYPRRLDSLLYLLPSRSYQYSHFDFRFQTSLQCLLVISIKGVLLVFPHVIRRYFLIYSLCYDANFSSCSQSEETQFCVFYSFFLRYFVLFCGIINYNLACVSQLLSLASNVSHNNGFTLQTFRMICVWHVYTSTRFIITHDFITFFFQTE